MNATDWTMLIEILAPVSLIGMGWLLYLQAQFHTSRRAGGVYALLAIVLPVIGLSDPGVFSALILNGAAIAGIGISRLRDSNIVETQYTNCKERITKDSSAHPVGGNQSD